MQETVREYLSMEDIQSLVRRGIMPDYTGWSSCNGFELLFEVRYEISSSNE